MSISATDTALGNEPLWRRAASDLVGSVRDGSLTTDAFVDAFLARVAAREGEIHAWAWHDADAVLAQLRALKGSNAALPLLGIPIGVKDVFDTADMPTSYGSPIYAGHRPTRDAEIVARLRAAGAIIMGKTVTTEFAYAHPGPTRNPHNADHTPGGSSSGSAAAVGAGMVPLALGTQTGGSTIRPAAFCGIVGFKPTHGVIPVTGMKALSPSMDTVGIQGRFVDDVALVYYIGAGIVLPEPTTQPRATPRIFYYPGPYADHADADGRRALEQAREVLGRAGFAIEDARLSDAFGGLSDANRTIMSVEAAECLRGEYSAHRSEMSAVAAKLVESGRHTNDEHYCAALTLSTECREALTKALGENDILMTFPAPGEAPLFEAGTGDSIFNRAWTTIGAPCITLPFGRGTTAGLPLGIQFVAAPHRDAELLAIGRRIEQLFEPFNG
jgi:Asp-tRNA(Asn)/Glu-tRNA(Gln) amidotransferase A subunit family amidase